MTVKTLVQRIARQEQAGGAALWDALMAKPLAAWTEADYGLMNRDPEGYALALERVSDTRLLDLLEEAQLLLVATGIDDATALALLGDMDGAPSPRGWVQ